MKRILLLKRKFLTYVFSLFSISGMALNISCVMYGMPMPMYGIDPRMQKDEAIAEVKDFIQRDNPGKVFIYEANIQFDFTLDDLNIKFIADGYDKNNKVAFVVADPIFYEESDITESDKILDLTENNAIVKNGFTDDKFNKIYIVNRYGVQKSRQQ